MKIAVCVTERNRPEVFKKSLDNIKKFQPKGSRIFIVDDASDIPIENADYRFDENVGIATAKNKCLELAHEWGAEDIFLLDSDCYPVNKDWYKPYTQSKEHHLMYIFKDFSDNNGRLKDCKEIYRDKQIVAYSHPRGCMIYLNRVVLDKVGGFDTEYGLGMEEHIDYSNRIYNAGLTTFRYMDVPDSYKLIHSMDEEQTVQSSIPKQVRQENLIRNKQLSNKNYESTEYCEFKEINKNIVLTAYFTQIQDPQREDKWQTKSEDLNVLIDSVLKHDQKLVILHNNLRKKDFRKGVEYVKVDCNITPYFQRWIEYYRHLREADVDNVFIVDSTDTQMLKNPFNHFKKGVIYLGDELETLNKRWMLANSHSSTISQTLRINRHRPILNCGVIGGSKKDLMELCHDIFKTYFDNGQVDQVEMPIFNHLMYTKYKDKIEYGRHITTRFKKYEYDNTEAFFRHK